MVSFVLRLKSVFHLIIYKETAVVGGSPESSLAVLHATVGIVDIDVFLFQAVLLVSERLDVARVAGYADDALIVCSHPDASLPILADMSDVAAREIGLALSHGEGVAFVVRLHHAHAVARTDPHRLVT